MATIPSAYASDSDSRRIPELRTDAIKGRLEPRLAEIETANTNKKTRAVDDLMWDLSFLRDRKELPGARERSAIVSRLIAVYRGIPDADPLKSTLKRGILELVTAYGDGRAELPFIKDAIATGSDDDRWAVVGWIGSPGSSMPRPARFHLVDQSYREGKLSFKMWVQGIAASDQKLARPVLRRIAEDTRDLGEFVLAAKKLLYCGGSDEIPFVLSRMSDFESGSSLSDAHPFRTVFDYEEYAKFLRHAEGSDLVHGIDWMLAGVTSAPLPVGVVLERDLINNNDESVRRSAVRFMGRWARDLGLEPERILDLLNSRLNREQSQDVRAAINAAIVDANEGLRRKKRLERQEGK